MLSKKKDAEDIRKQKISSQSLGLPGLGNLRVALTLSMDSLTEHQGDKFHFHIHIYILKCEETLVTLISLCITQLNVTDLFSIKEN